MRALSEVAGRLRALFFGDREDRDLDEELRFHVDMATEENVRQGLSPREARRRAQLRLGGPVQVREATRDARGVRWVEEHARDVRYALRGLRRNPLFSTTVVLTLALGLGAMAAMFGVADALLLRPLPYHEPDRLVEVLAVTQNGDMRPYIPWDRAQVWHQQSEVFQGAFSHARGAVLFTGGSEPQVLSVQAVTHEFEEVLGVRPILGRGLAPEDADPGAPPVVVLDHAFWHRVLGGDTEVIGRVIELEGAQHRVVGVMPAGFKFPEYSTTEAWMPIRSDGSFLGPGGGGAGLYFVARLAEGSLPVAQIRADAIASTLSEQQARGEGWSVMLRPFGAATRAQNSRVLWLLGGAVAVLLLIAGINATALLLVRGWSRSRELAVRAALGASRWRVARQLLTESVILGLLSGVAAVVLALVALSSFRGIIPGSITFFAPFEIKMELRTLGFTFLVATATGFVIGLFPALLAARSSSPANHAALTTYASATSQKNRLRRGLVVVEMSLTVMLLVGAGLLTNSFVQLMRVEPGFRVENLAVLRLNLPSSSYPSSTSRAAFLRILEERLEALPEVRGVSVNGGVPPTSGFHFGVALETEAGMAPSQPQLLPFANIRPDFFEVLEVPIAAGRPLREEDVGTDNVMIDLDMARLLWGRASPLGRSFRIGAERPWLTVVGVTRDLRLMGPDDRNGSYEILYPLGPNTAPSYVPLAIRTGGDPRPLLASIRSIVHELDSLQPIEELRPAIELYAATIAMPRFLLVLMAVLSGLALFLAAVGTHGMLAYGVVQRRNELGIRIALGAPTRRIWLGVVAEGVFLAAVGAGFGVILALTFSRAIGGLLYAVEPSDPRTIIVAVSISVAAAAIACFSPARRAVIGHPADVLRAD